jgi:hypothetical protein
LAPAALLDQSSWESAPSVRALRQAVRRRRGVEIGTVSKQPTGRLLEAKKVMQNCLPASGVALWRWSESPLLWVQ